MCQRRFELTDLVGAQHIVPHAARRHDVALVARGGEAGLGFEYLQPAERSHEVLGPCQRDQLAVRRIGVGNQRLQRIGDRVDPAMAAR